MFQRHEQFGDIITEQMFDIFISNGTQYCVEQIQIGPDQQGQAGRFAILRGPVERRLLAFTPFAHLNDDGRHVRPLRQFIACAIHVQ